MKKSLLSLVAVAALSTTLLAGDIKVSGFVNIVGGVNDVNPNKYVSGETSESYRDYDDQYDFTNESLAGIQFSSNISNKMGATIQLIVQKEDANDDIQMEWGYISYDATDELRILAGRIRPALFLYSDYLDVGYAYNWITPPDEVYSQVSISKLDGASVTYNLELGDNTLSTTLYGGNSYAKGVNTNDLSIDLDFTYDNIIGGEVVLSNDYLKLRAGLIKVSLTESTTLDSLPAELQMDESDAMFYGVGLSMDYEDIIFATEYIGKNMEETSISPLNAYYAMIGYKVGDFTPSYTFAGVDSEMNFSSVTAVNTARALKLDDRTSHTVGVRYDVNSKAALKLEWNTATVTHSTYASGTTLTQEDENINTYRIALNVIF